MKKVMIFLKFGAQYPEILHERFTMLTLENEK